MVVRYIKKCYVMRHSIEDGNLIQQTSKWDSRCEFIARFYGKRDLIIQYKSNWGVGKGVLEGLNI